MRPADVDLHVEVDPAAGRRFKGRVGIELDVARPQGHLELHAVDLRVNRVQLRGSDGSVMRGTIQPRPSLETLLFSFASPVPAGRSCLELSFSGTLRSDLRGLYLAVDGERRYAVTQLEATDARRFFPCFDEPAFKARFRLVVTTAGGHTVVSNGPLEREESLPDGRKTVHFARTPPLSTYLVALAVGAFESSAPERVGDTEIRVRHVPGKGHLTDFALETARETLARLERYFDLPYPYAKLDLVAVPDFEAGAMENAGAVFFRETLLLTDSASVTLAEKKRVAEVICHELAHMWYGDLVTMAWWDDLWLNEAFATWMAFHVVDDWQPEWRMWLDFQHMRAAALDLDALRNTHPIYVDVASPEEATANFDLITYEKGASVVRMLERYLGASAFRKGVRRYIRRHREGNAVAADLWRALAEASGQDVAPIVRAWIEQPGHPLLAVRRGRGRKGPWLELRQQRFRSRSERDDGSRWPIPWVGRLGRGRGRSSRLERRLVTGGRERLDLAAEPGFVYANADEGGFFRPVHPADELRALAGARHALSAVERMGLVQHQWAAVHAGHAELEGFLELVGAWSDETDPDVLAAIRGPLDFIDRQLAAEAGAPTRESFHAWLIDRFGGSLLELGWDPADGEPDAVRLRRAEVLAILGGIAGWEPVLEAAEGRFEAFLDDRGALDPNLADLVVTLAARTADTTRWQRLREAAEKAGTPQERRRFLLALGEVRAARLVDRALKLTLTPAVPTQDVVFLLVRLLGNPSAREATWAFATGRWPKLSKRMPSMLVTRFVDALPALQTEAYRREVRDFFDRHPVPTATRALRQASERFRRNAAVRQRGAPALRRWLSTQVLPNA